MAATASPRKDATATNPMFLERTWSYRFSKKCRGWGGRPWSLRVMAFRRQNASRDSGDVEMAVSIFSFGLFDVPARGIPQAVEYLVSPGRQVEDVPVMPFGWLLVLEKGLAAPDLQVFPVPLSPKATAAANSSRNCAGSVASGSQYR